MSKAILVVYIVSILGTGNGVRDIQKYSTYENMQDCQTAAKTLIVKDFGEGVSGRVVAFCSSSDLKDIKLPYQ